MNEIQEIEDAIVEINGEIFEIGEDLHEKYSLILTSDGGTHIVKYLGNTIYNSQDDCRDWNDDKDDYYITIEQHLRDCINNESRYLGYIRDHFNKLRNK